MQEGEDPHVISKELNVPLSQVLSWRLDEDNSQNPIQSLQEWTNSFNNNFNNLSSDKRKMKPRISKE